MSTLVVAAVTVMTAATSYSEAYGDPYWLFLEKPAEWRTGDPVPDGLVDAVTAGGARIRTVSRYFNAISVDWDGAGDRLAAIPGVREVRPVKNLGKTTSQSTVNKLTKPAAPQDGTGNHLLNYGESYEQLNLLNIPALHDKGYYGEGVVIGVLDAGFITDGVPCLENVNIAHTWNFITGGPEVDNGGQLGNQHGTQVLACLAGWQPGVYLGAAFGSTYLLALTEDAYSETPAEEDRWIAGAEWCESHGAKIISSSLVYNEFDLPYPSYNVGDMDGKTTLLAKWAEIAWSRGILVVNAAGNEGTTPGWWIVATPADAEHVLSVGAFFIPRNEAGPLEILTSSSHGPTADGRIKPDVVAPGGEVKVPILSIPNYYTYTSGTSFSTPLVAGLCALLMEAHPDWTNADVFQAVRSTAIDLGNYGPDNVYGWGVPDALAAWRFDPITVAVEDTDASGKSAPAAFTLGSPFPNPFNASVTIPFTLDHALAVAVDIFDVAGHRVSRLQDGPLPAGNHEAVWRATGCGSGIYIVRITGGGASRTARTVLVK